MAAAKFDSKCGTCGDKVAKGTGSVTKNPSTAKVKWDIRCDICVAVGQAHKVFAGREMFRFGKGDTGTCFNCGSTEARFGRDVWQGDWISGCEWLCGDCAVAAVATIPAPAPRPTRPAWTRTTFEDRLIRMVSPEGVTVMVHEPDVYDAQKDGFRVA